MKQTLNALYLNVDENISKDGNGLTVHGDSNNIFQLTEYKRKPDCCKLDINMKSD